MYSTKRSDAAMDLINEFKTHDLTRKSSSEVVKLERVNKSGDNYSLTIEFLANSTHIVARISQVWLGF